METKNKEWRIDKLCIDLETACTNMDTKRINSNINPAGSPVVVFVDCLCEHQKR